VICASYALARRSWVELLTVGGIITLLLSLLVVPLPRTAAILAVTVNGGFLLVFLCSVARNAWVMCRSGRDG
jgi:hypothetical protein